MAINKEKATKNAEKYIKAGRLENAIAEYLSILKENPKDWPVRNQVGDLYARLGKVREAVHHWSEMAEFYAQDGFNLKAIATYAKVKRIDPQNAGVMLKLAELNAKQGLINDARNQYLEVAEVFQRQNKIEETLDVYRKIVDLDRENVKMRVKLAELYAKEKMIPQAVEEFSRVAEDLRRKGLVDECLEVLNQALNLDRKNGQAVLTLAQAQYDLGHRDMAVRIVEEALQADPHEANLLKFLGEVYQKSDELEKAERYYLRLAEVEPTATQSLLSLGDQLLKRNQLDRAFALYEPVVNMLIKQREGEKAIGLLRSILNITPGHIPTLRKLVEIYTSFKQRSNIIAALSTLSDALYLKGQTQEALSVIEKVIDLDPENYQHRERLLRFKGEKEAPGFQTADEAEAPPVRPIARGAAPIKPAVVREIIEHRDEPRPTRPAPTAADWDEGVPAQVLELLTEADVFMRYKLFDKAQEQLARALKLDPRNIRAHAHLKDIYEEKGRIADAVKECVLLSELYEERGDIEAAQRVLSDGSSLDPNDSHLVARIKELESGVTSGGTKPVQEPAAPAKAPAKAAAFAAKAPAAQRAAPPKPTAPPPAPPTPPSPAVREVEEEELDIDLGALEDFEEVSVAGAEPEDAGSTGGPAGSIAAAPQPSATEAQEIEMPEIDLDFVSFEEEEAEAPRPAPRAELRQEAAPPREATPPPQVRIEPMLVPPVAPTNAPPLLEVPATPPAFEPPQGAFDDELVPELQDLRAEVERFSIDLEEEASAAPPASLLASTAAESLRRPSAPREVEHFDIEIEEEARPATVGSQAPAPPVPAAPAPAAPAPPPPSARASVAKKPTTQIGELERELERLHLGLDETAKKPPARPRPPAPPAAGEEPPIARPPEKKKMTLDDLLMEDIHELEEIVKDTAKMAPAHAVGPPPQAARHVDEEAPADLISSLDEIELIEEGAALPAVEPLVEGATAPGLDEIFAAPPPPPPPPSPPPVAPAPREEEEEELELELERKVEITAVSKPPVAPTEAVPMQAGAEVGEGFFDLSSELEAELLKAETVREAAEEGEIITDESQSYQEKSLEELFTEFRAGIEKQLGDEDYDTRYNLGIAYKEMGLIDEAIGEFQTAARDPNRLLECCSLLGLCFMEKGMPKQAIAWLKKGLESPGHKDVEYQGLRYDLGIAYQQVGEYGKALEVFRDVFGFNANYRAVGDRIKEIQSLMARSKGQ
ncbi:MAG: tetratricopeptide repeat protein [Acidobacteria bacterium]|nr:tetratricopeptide repeat protein [Acidobacteriota bacterium]